MGRRGVFGTCARLDLLEAFGPAKKAEGPLGGESGDAFGWVWIGLDLELKAFHLLK